MTIKHTSHFKSPDQDIAWFEKWMGEVEKNNGRQYQRLDVQTSLGKTKVWGLHTDKDYTESLVIFPGFRTTPLFWDLDRLLDKINYPVKIYLVETNGQPNPSDGHTPTIKSTEYGEWANEVLEKLSLKQTYIAGASFGGMVCMKLSITNPEKIKAAFLLNPGGLQRISLDPVTWYYLILPILKTTPKNVSKFLDKVVFCKPNHQLSPEAEKLVNDYEVFAINRYKDNTEKPYYMKRELSQVKIKVFLLEGNKDPMFPYDKSVASARKNFTGLQEARVFENVGHGIECYGPAMEYIGEKMKWLKQNV